MKNLLPGEDRLLLMQKGADQLHTWLNDIIRIGIIEYDFTEDSLAEVAARMVDAKLGSIGRRIRQLANIERADPTWTGKLQSELTLLYLFVFNFKKLSSHTLPMQMTLLTWAGYNIRKKDLNPDKGIKDVWYLLGQTQRKEEQLRVRQVWMVGLQSHRFAILIDYAFGRTSFDHTYRFGEGYRGRLNYFPSTFPLRGALFSPETVKLPRLSFPAYNRIDTFLDQFASAIAKNPWISSFPCALDQVTIIFEHLHFYAVDLDHKMLPLHGSDEILWSLTSISGGRGIRIFGSWNGHSLKVMSYLSEGRIVSLAIAK